MMMKPGFSNVRAVLFADGRIERHNILMYLGACLAGDPTAYVLRDGVVVWVVPGETVAFREHA